jgi:hypothetical protein
MVAPTLASRLPIDDTVSLAAAQLLDEGATSPTSGLVGSANAECSGCTYAARVEECTGIGLLFLFNFRDPIAFCFYLRTYVCKI